MDKKHKNDYTVLIEFNGIYKQFAIICNYEGSGFNFKEEQELLQYVKYYINDFVEISLGHVSNINDLELTSNLSMKVFEIVNQYRDLI